LDGEKVDFIENSEDPIQMIKNCLKPAQINSIDIKEKRAIVVMDDSQKALAIGK